MHGLRLTLGGAANSPHVVTGVPGTYRPDVPTPVGGKGQISLERAQKIAADPAVPLELVEIEDAEQAQATADKDVSDLKRHAPRAARSAKGQGEKQIAREQMQALTEIEN